MLNFFYCGEVRLNKSSRQWRHCIPDFFNFSSVIYIVYSLSVIIQLNIAADIAEILSLLSVFFLLSISRRGLTWGIFTPRGKLPLINNYHRWLDSYLFKQKRSFWYTVICLSKSLFFTVQIYIYNHKVCFQNNIALEF